MFCSFYHFYLQESDGEKSDQDLVVDVANEMVSFISKNLHTQKKKSIKKICQTKMKQKRNNKHVKLSVFIIIL